MTLSKQIILIFVGALSLLFMGTFFITIHQVKGYFEGQLAHNAQDSATALGLTLSKQLGKKTGKAMILAEVKAVFDRGNYSQIEVHDIQGKLLVSRTQKKSKSVAPQWFKSFIPIENNSRTALIMDGWKQVGWVYVKSNADLSYLSLWRTAKSLFLLFSTLTLLLSFLGAWLIQARFKPLKQIIQQAKDIGNKKFYLISYKPKLPELQALSEAMNKMVDKIQKAFSQQLEETEALRKKAYVDPLTGFGNRRFFFQQLEYFLSVEDTYSSGHLILIELSGLMQYNKKHGRHGGDQILIEFAMALKTTLENQNIQILSRLDGPNFACLLLDEQSLPIHSITPALYQKLNALVHTKDTTLNCSIGVIRYQFGVEASSLMHLADKALVKAKERLVESYFIQPADEIGKEIFITPTHDQVHEAIDNNLYRIHIQPVRSENKEFHYECFIKLVTPAGEVPASRFLPIANELGLESKIDEYMLTTLFNLKNYQKPLAVNLSSAILFNDKKRQEFFNLLKKHAKTKKNAIHFEVSERIFAQNIKETLSFFKKVTGMGYKVGIDHVGAFLLSFDNYKSRHINYLKLDRTFSKHLSENEDKEHIIKNLVDLCRDTDIQLIATLIESESQWHQLKELGITWFQGNYIQSTMPIEL